MAVVAASVFPLFGNSAEDVSPKQADLEALAPITEKPVATATKSGCGGSCCSSKPGAAGGWTGAARGAVPRGSARGDTGGSAPAGL